MKEPITVIVTSCGRFDLLARTIDSLLLVSNHPISKIIIHDDSCSKLVFDRINKYIIHASNIFSIDILLFSHPEKIGLARSLDFLTSKINNEYYITIEDDWFFESNASFVKQSLIILKNNPDINQVWIRDDTDHSHPLGKPYELNGVMVRDVLKGYQGHWGGFSFNPCVRRLSDYKKYFPNGYAEFGDEALCSKHVERVGYKAVSLVHSACKHIGYGRHTDNFKV